MVVAGHHRIAIVVIGHGMTVMVVVEHYRIAIAVYDVELALDNVEMPKLITWYI